MKVAISTQGHDLEASVEPRFGRSQRFIVVDVDTLSFDILENLNTDAVGGAGVQTAQQLARSGAKVVLTGDCGPKAFQTLQAAGIEVLTNVSGTIREAIEQYKFNDFAGR